MKLLKKYFDLQQQIYNYFGYKEDWFVIPLSDETEQYWFLIENETVGRKVVYSPKKLTQKIIKDGNVLYSGTIYRQRFLNRWVYRTFDFTMISVDTHTDGNKFLMIFDNTKEQNDPELKELYLKTWRKL